MSRNLTVEQLALEWRVICENYPLALRKDVFETVLEHREHLATLFYEHMLPDPACSFFLSDEIVKTRLHNAMLKWLENVFDLGINGAFEQEVALHPGRSARIDFNGQPIGWIGELHPRLVQQADLLHAPVVFEVEVEALSEGQLPQVHELSRQPVVVRDLALWVDLPVNAQAMLDTVAATIAADATLAVVQDARVFDVWRDKPQDGKPVTEKSLAFRFWLQDTEVTLDEARVADCLARITQALVSAHGARQRT